MVRDGAKKAVVRLIVGEDEIVRSKGTENLYVLNGDEFKSFRTSVPAPVSEALNLQPINFQSQHDASYWFSESSGEVGRQLNAMVNLGVIDDTLSYVNREVTRAKASVELTEERLASAVEEKKALAWTAECDEDLVGVEDLKGRLFEKKEVIHVLKCRLEEVSDAEDRRDRSRRMSDDASSLSIRMKSVGMLSRKRTDLEQVLSSARTAEEQMDEDVPDMEQIESGMSLLSGLGVSRAFLEDAIQRARDGFSEAKKFVRRAEEVETELHDCVEACPLCGRSF